MGDKRMLLGLIGYPLGHSWSAAFFSEKFKNEGLTDKEYRLFPLSDLNDFPGLLLNYPDLAGLNVTIPYKEKIIPYLDELDETARLVGAVNTIRIYPENGISRTRGYNTDSMGFYLTLKDQIKHCNALILGTGGASKAIAFALQQLHIPYTFVSRVKSDPGVLSYNELTVEIINDNRLIINTTPLGMYPDLTSFPQLPYEGLTRDHLLYDLVYNPEETVFLKKGKALGTNTMNGKQMLINQANLSYEIFLG